MSELLSPAADTAAWIPWIGKPDGRFHDLLGQMYFRVTPNGVESKMDTDRRHSNGLGYLHGGFLMSFVDMAMFAIIRPRFTTGEGAVTLSCATDFLTGGVPGTPLEAHGEVLKETGKLFFVRGLITQGGANVCSFTGTMRKITRRTLPGAVRPGAVGPDTIAPDDAPASRAG